MKKLIFASALVMGSLSAFAINTAIFENGIVKVMLQGEFKEIPAGELPQAVQESLKADYPDWQLAKAYVNEKGIYKLEVQSSQGETATLYADKDGKWVQI